jgi:hypothetical protein
MDSNVNYCAALYNKVLTFRPQHRRMLITWFYALLGFIKTQWLPISCALATLFIWESGRRKLRKSEKKLAEHKADAFVELARRDEFLITAAKQRVGEDASSRCAFIDIIGFRMDFLMRKFKRAQVLSKRLGLLGLSGAAISSYITGSNSLGGYTVAASFFVTSISSIALAINTFIAADQDTVSNLILLERTRLELAEFISCADSYEGLDQDTAYYLMAKTVNGLFADSISSQETALKAKIAAHNATEPKETPPT